MLRLIPMATPSGSGSGQNPTAPAALSDEQAEQFAASFTPSWDAGDGDSGDANATVVDAPAVAAVQATAILNVAPPAPAAPAFHAKQTLIGTAPQANAPIMAGTNGGHEVRASASSAEAIDPENILDSSTAPAPVVRAPVPAPAPAVARQAQSRPAPAPAATNARVAVNADPFAASATAGPRARGARPVSDDLDEDFVPKKSSKTVYFVIAGLAIAAGLGLFLKFALSDDSAKATPEQHATGPAVTTAEIPPPPPKVDTPPPATAATTATAKVDPAPPPATLPAPLTPATARAPEPPAAPTHVATTPVTQPRPRTPPPPPPAMAAPPPVTPKTPPKPANGSIVRDNPF